MHRRWWRIHRVSIVWMCLIVLLGTSSCGSSSSTTLTQFSHDGQRYDASLWSPNGRWLAAESYDTQTAALFTASGNLVTSFQRGCDLSNGAEDISWLPDGRFSCFAAATSAHLLYIDTLGQGGQLKARVHITAPIPPNTFLYAMQWNPRHFWLAALATKMPGTMERALYLSDLSGHSLISPVSVDAEELTWSPDGTMLALVLRNGDTLLLKVEQQTPGRLVLTTIRQLAAGTEQDEPVVWSPSGLWLICRHGSSESEDYLFLLAADGSGKQVKLTSSITDGQLDFPAWSPDGKQLMVSRMSDGVLMSLDIAKLLKAKGVKP